MLVRKQIMSAMDKALLYPDEVTGSAQVLFTPLSSFSLVLLNALVSTLEQTHYASHVFSACCCCCVVVVVVVLLLLLLLLYFIFIFYLKYLIGTGIGQMVNFRQKSQAQY